MPLKQLSEELENGTEILIDKPVFKLYGSYICNSQNIVLINDSRTTWPT